MKSSICLSNQVRRLSQAAFERLRHIPSEGLIWRANEDDPRKHTSSHEGLFYQMPTDSKQLLQIFGLQQIFAPSTQKFHKTLGMIPMMVRQPALDTMNRLRTIKDSECNVKILLHGDEGHGKTHILYHLIHYLYLCQTHIIIHIRDMRKFTRSPLEFNDSTSRPGRIDTPLNAALLLQQFRVQNSFLLEKLGDTLACSQDYTWTSREVTKAGEPLTNIATHGINRVNHASDCVAVLLKELMLAADSGKIKLVSVMDHVKNLYEREAGVLKHVDHKKVLVDEIIVARALKKMIKGNHKNAIVIGSCEELMTRRQNISPRELLGIEGFNEYNPDLCLEVPKYSRKEFESCMNFYQDIGWLCRPESKTQEARDEIRFTSGLNPGQVEYLCQAL